MKLYEGVVVNNNDPKQVGKVQIRIPSLNGNGISGNSVPNESLPWYEPCMPGYGGYQSGSFIVPPLGSIIWCIIDEVESGDARRIYIGGSYGVGAQGDKEFGGKSVPRGKLETPVEAVDGYPDSMVILKSINGSIIYIDNTGDIILKYGKAIVTVTNGAINLNASSVNIKGDITLDGQIEITGATTIQSSLNVKGATDIQSSLNVSGDATIRGIGFSSHTHTAPHYAGETSGPH